MSELIRIMVIRVLTFYFEGKSFQIVDSSSKEDISSIPPPPTSNDIKDEASIRPEGNRNSDEDAAGNVSGMRETSIWAWGLLPILNIWALPREIGYWSSENRPTLQNTEERRNYLASPMRTSRLPTAVSAVSSPSAAAAVTSTTRKSPFAMESPQRQSMGLRGRIPPRSSKKMTAKMIRYNTMFRILHLFMVNHSYHWQNSKVNTLVTTTK